MPSRRASAGGGRRWILWVLALVVGIPLAAYLGYVARPLPPVVVLSTDLLDFGAVRLGEAGTLRFRIANEGESPLRLLEATIIDATDGGASMGGAGVFSVASSEPCLSQALETGASCELAVEYRPNASVVQRGRLRLSTNAGETARTVPLFGEGIAPELRAGPPRLELGRQVVGRRGGRGEIWLENLGAASLRVASVGLDGLAAADFVQFSDRCSGAELGPGERCTVQFELIPTAAGERRARLEIRSDAAALVDPPVLVGEGEAQQPLLTVEPNRVDLGRQRVGRAGELWPISVRNEGTGPLEIEAVQVIGLAAGDREVREGGRLTEEGPSTSVTEPGSGARTGGGSSFALEDRGCAGTRLEPGEECGLEVGFSPLDEGATGGLVEIAHSAGPAPYRVPVVGEGIAPRARLRPSRLSFGEVPVGKRSGWQSLRIGNEGSADLLVSSVEVGGGDRVSFEVRSEGCSGTPVSPGRSCGVEVRFAGRREGPHRARLIVLHDGVSSAPDRAVPGNTRTEGTRSQSAGLENARSGETGSGEAGLGNDVEEGTVAEVALSGIGTRARLAVGPAALDFGSVPMSSARVLDIELRSVGRAPVTVGRMRVSGGVGRDLRVEKSCAGKTIEPGEICVASVRFSPSSVGARRGRVRIEHGGGEVVEVAMSGTGLPEPVARLQVSPERIDFAARVVGSPADVVTVTLMNRGDGALVIRDIAIEGDLLQELDWVPGTCAESLAPGGRCALQVTFSPKREGERQAVLVIRHDAPGGVDRLLLLGRGLPSGSGR